MKWPRGHVDRRGFASAWYLQYGTWYRRCVNGSAAGRVATGRAVDWGEVHDGAGRMVGSFVIGPSVPA